MTDWYKCPNCTKPIAHGVQKCSQCKCILDWRQKPPTIYMLADGSVPAAVPAAMPPTAPTGAQPPYQPVYGCVTCVNCGNVIIPVRQKADGCLVVIAFLFFVIPGILYVLYCQTRPSNMCPACGKNAYVIKP